MEERVRRILEYDKIAAQIASHAISDLGKRHCADMRPMTKHELVQRLLEMTGGAQSVMLQLGGNPMQPFEDIRELLNRCAVGGIPAPGELLFAAKTLRSIRLVKSRIAQANEIGTLATLLNGLSPAQRIEEEIFRCIIGEEEIADDASTELRRIRRQIKLASERVRQKLNEIMQSASSRPMLQDAIITMRNGRYVVPVKAEFAGAMGGLEHDRSASGATVFIEPLAVLKANNELRELEAAERNEIQRILQALGGLLGEVKESVALSIENLGELDLLFAKADWAKAQKAVFPEVGAGGGMKLVAARHPLISRDRVVPIDLVLDVDTKALIITGPNTGGKTVTLKTAGLFVLLAQSGVFLPCDKAQLPFFHALYADIGDEQSIEQSLSTFSSHMVNLVDIVRHAGSGTLVLADELGVGTDPVEGAALAIAMLEALTGQGATVIATTHYSELKSFAMTEPGYVNAGMEFDSQTLMPTYRVMIGFASSSNAFEISRRLGLPDEIIENAKEKVSDEAMRLEDAIRAAENLRMLAQRQLQQALDNGKVEREALERELDLLRQKAQKDGQRAKETLEKARRMLEDAKTEANSAIELARQAASAQNNRERELLLQQARTTVRAMSDLSADLGSDPEEEDAGEPLVRFEIGERAFVASLKTEATILSKPDGKGDVQVQAGILKLTVPKGQLRRAAKKAEAIPAARVKREDRAVPMQIDVRGLTVDEAVVVIDMHLDACILSGMQQTGIIHGKGTGALRAGVRAYLQSHTHVRSIRRGEYGEGDDGVTVVELK